MGVVGINLLDKPKKETRSYTWLQGLHKFDTADQCTDRCLNKLNILIGQLIKYVAAIHLQVAEHICGKISVLAVDGLHGRSMKSNLQSSVP